MNLLEYKGIIFADRSGISPYQATLSAPKQLLPSYEKPVIYHPLTSLMMTGMREALIISTPQDIPRFEQLMGDGRSGA